MKKLFLICLAMTLIACGEPTKQATIELEQVTQQESISFIDTTYTTQESSFSYDEKEIYGTLYQPDTPSDVTIIMAHGYGGSSQDVHIFADYFAKKGITCYTFDFCGGGATKSTGTMMEMSILTEKEDLNAVIDHVQTITSSHHLWLLGQSQGGLVSTMCAKDRQDEIEGLLLVYPAFAIPDMVLERYPTEEAVPSSAPMFYGTVSDLYFLDAMHTDIWNDLSEIEIPVFISHGDQDTLIPYESAQKACSILQNCTLYTVEGASHGYIESVTLDVNEQMMTFLEASISE